MKSGNAWDSMKNSKLLNTLTLTTTMARDDATARIPKTGCDDLQGKDASSVPVIVCCFVFNNPA